MPQVPHVRRARGAVAGAAAAGGGLLAHSMAGGTVTAVPVLAALVLSVTLGLTLVRPDRVDVTRLVAQAVLAQALCHGIFLMSPPEPGHAGHSHGVTGAGVAFDPVAMVGLHLAVALCAAALAAGLDGALLELARQLTRWLLPPLPRLDPVGTPDLTTEVRHDVVVPSSRPVSPTGARGPPPALSPAVPIPA